MADERTQLFGNKPKIPRKNSNEKTTEELQEETRTINQRSTAKLEDYLRIINETNDIAAGTQQTLDHQTSQLKNTSKKVTNTNQNVDASRKIIREMNYSSWDPRFWFKSLR